MGSVSSLPVIDKVVALIPDCSYRCPEHPDVKLGSYCCTQTLSKCGTCEQEQQDRLGVFLKITKTTSTGSVVIRYIVAEKVYSIGTALVYAFNMDNHSILVSSAGKHCIFKKRVGRINLLDNFSSPPPANPIQYIVVRCKLEGSFIAKSSVVHVGAVIVTDANNAGIVYIGRDQQFTKMVASNTGACKCTPLTVENILDDGFDWDSYEDPMEASEYGSGARVAVGCYNVVEDTLVEVC